MDSFGIVLTILLVLICGTSVLLVAGILAGCAAAVFVRLKRFACRLALP